MSTKDAVASIGQHTNMMARERGITLPIVARGNGSIVLHRLIYTQRAIPREGTFIFAPQYIASYDLTRGVFLSVEKFEGDFSDQPPPPWKSVPPSFAKTEDIIPEYERIWLLYDVLISAFERGAAADATLKSSAREYLGYFERHAEAPLLRQYEQLGGDFLSYVRKLAS